MSLFRGRPPGRTPDDARRAGSAASTSSGFSWRAFLLYNVAIAVVGSTLRAVFIGSWRGWGVAFVAPRTGSRSCRGSADRWWRGSPTADRFP